MSRSRNPVKLDPEFMTPERVQEHIEKAMRKYKDWFWRDADAVIRCHIPIPKIVSADTGKEFDLLAFMEENNLVFADLYIMGMPVSIIYVAEREGIPDVQSWQHNFGEETGEFPVLVGSANDPNFLLIFGGDFEVTPRGIVK